MGITTMLPVDPIAVENVASAVASPAESMKKVKNSVQEKVEDVKNVGTTAEEKAKAEEKKIQDKLAKADAAAEKKTKDLCPGTMPACHNDINRISEKPKTPEEQALLEEGKKSKLEQQKLIENAKANAKNKAEDEQQQELKKLEQEKGKLGELTELNPLSPNEDGISLEKQRILDENSNNIGGKKIDIPN